MAQATPMRLPDFDVGRPHFRLGGDLAAGTIIGNGITNKVLIPIHGARVVRLRALVTVAAATLKARYVMPTDFATEYAANQPADVALIAGTENILDITTVAGEAYLSVQVTSGGAGMSVSYVDACQYQST
jgi:hypothetical protein